MKLIAFSVLLLVSLEESYCKTTSSVNKTSTSWGYGYRLSDTRGFKVKHDDKGYHFEPFYNITSSGLKKNYNSRSTYDQFTSPAATNDSQLHISTNDVINGTSNSRSNGTVERSQGDKVFKKVLFHTSTGGETTPKFHRVPVTNTHTVTGTKIQTATPSSLHSIPVGDIIRSANVPSNGKLYETTFGVPYGSLNTPTYAAPTGPLYYPQAPSYGQMYGPAGGSMYGIPNGQMYEPSMYPTYGSPTGGTYAPISPIYGLPTRSMHEYAPQNGQMYGPPNGPMYVPNNGQTYGYPTGYESNRNY